MNGCSLVSEVKKMNIDKLQKMQYEVCMMASECKTEKAEDCIFDIFFSISNLIKLMTSAAGEENGRS